MKCPKCSYIGFEPADRCRNCGFDFSLTAVDAPASELPLRPGQTMGPLADFDLGEARRPPRPAASGRASGRTRDPAFDPGVPLEATGPGVGELPLFGDVFPDDPPLVRPAAPGAPLAVRRSTPVRPRSTIAARLPERQSDPVLPLDAAAGLSNGRPAAPGTTEWAADAVASIGRRIGAAAIDGLLLLALDASVVYFTLKASRLTASEVGLLPPMPLAVFLLLLNGGYLALFTAATGQTIGKMAFGLRVVSAEARPPTVGRALMRVVALLVSALPAGLGLVPAGFDRAHRGLHDRLADTRVVRTSAS
jgi:uncharacterized RDD family membrane protein YckC